MRDVRRVEKVITEEVESLTQTTGFSKWLVDQSPANDDLIVFNNSFIYRDKPLIKTTKNEQYLCLKTKDSTLQMEVFVVKAGGVDTDFKLFRAKSRNLPGLEPLGQAIDSELGRLGQLLFVLIGDITDVPSSVRINHRYAAELYFDPPSTDEIEAAAVVDVINGTRRITVHQLRDAEAAWKEIESTVQTALGEDSESLATEFATAYEKLKKEAVSKLQFPSPGASMSESSFIARLRQAVADQRKLYDEALERCEREGALTGLDLNEVLRIAYNFAGDALKALQLLVCLSDLKAVLLWCTIRDHFDVADAFKSLPWTKNAKKPSLKGYYEIISGARNSAFHNLFEFDRSIESDLHGVSIGARSLTLLQAHGRGKSHVALDYEDRELVQVLAELTRAPETAVSMDFWKRNSQVMKAFEGLLAKMGESLSLINMVRR